MKRRLLSLVLAVTMVLSLLPTAAFANDLQEHNFVKAENVAVDETTGAVTGKIEFTSGVTENVNTVVLLISNVKYNTTACDNTVFETAINRHPSTVKPTFEATSIKLPAYMKLLEADNLLGGSSGAFTLDASGGTQKNGAITRAAIEAAIASKNLTVSSTDQSDYDAKGYPYTLYIYNTKNDSYTKSDIRIGAPAKQPAVLKADPVSVVATVDNTGAPKLTGNTFVLQNGANMQTATLGTISVTGDAGDAVIAGTTITAAATSAGATIAAGASETITISAVDPSLITSSVSGAVLIQYNNGAAQESISVPFLIKPDTASIAISASPATIDLGTVSVGYAAEAVKSPSITLTGQGGTTYLTTKTELEKIIGASALRKEGFTDVNLAPATVAGIQASLTMEDLGGGNIQVSETSKNAENTITPAGKTFTIQLPIGLAEGTYNDRYTLIYTDGSSYGTLSIPVTLTVTAAAKTLNSIAINGNPEVGTQLATTLQPGGATATYQWSVGDAVGAPFTDIAGATSDNYTPLPEHVGKFLKVTATGSNPYTGTVTTTTTAVAATANYQIGGADVTRTSSGFGTADIVSVAVNNLGNRELTNVKVALTSGAEDFALTQPLLTTIPVSEQTTFTVTPNKELSVGEHICGYTLTADNGATDPGTVKLIVKAKEATKIVLAPTSAVYDGSDKKPTTKVTDSTEKVTVPANQVTGAWKNSSDAIVTELIGAGTYTYTVTKITDTKYALPTPATFTIAPKQLPQPTLTKTDATTVGGNGTITVTGYDVVANYPAGTTFTISPQAGTYNAGVFTVPAGNYTVTAVKPNGNANYANSPASASVEVTQPVANTSFSLSETTTTESVVWGVAPTTHTITVTNNGNVALAGLAITPNTDTTNYTITNLGAATLAVGATTTFTVKLKDNLNASTTPYTETVTVSATGATSLTYTNNTTVTKATTAAPALVLANDATSYGGSEGALTITGGATKSYEVYLNSTKMTPQPNMADATGNKSVTGLVAGSYTVVQTAADANHSDSPASNAIIVADGDTYTGSVTIKVDGATTSLSNITAVNFVSQDGNVTIPTTAAGGVYTTATNALLHSKTSYTVHVTINNGTEITTASTVTAANSTASALDFYTVNYTQTAARSNTYPGSAFATAAAGTVSASAPIGTAGAAVALTSGHVVPTGTAVTFTVTDNDANAAEYTPSWSSGVTGTTTATHTYNAALVGPVMATLTQKLYAVSGTAPSASVSAVSATGTGVTAVALTRNANTWSKDLPRGTYTFTATASGGNVINETNPTAGVEITAPNSAAFAFTTTGPTWVLSVGDAQNGSYAATGSKAMTEISYSTVVGAGQTVTIWVKNTGNSKIFDVNVASSDAANFTITTPIPANTDLEKDATTSFTVKIADNRVVGNYSGVFTVSGAKADGGVSTGVTSAAYTTTLTVTAIPLTGVTIAVGADGLKAGTTLTASYTPAVKGLTEHDVTYEWYRDNAVIASADQSTYVLTADDEGKAITCKVTGKKNASGSQTSAPTAKVNYIGKAIVKVDDVATGSGKITSVAFKSTKPTHDVTATYITNEWVSTAALHGDETYEIFVNNLATGVNVSAPSAKSGTVDFYTVKYTEQAVITDGGATNVTVSATSGGTAVTSGDIVQKGTEVTFTNNDTSGKDYTYIYKNGNVAAQTGKSKEFKKIYNAKVATAVNLEMVLTKYTVQGWAGTGVSNVNLTGTNSEGTFPGTITTNAVVNGTAFANVPAGNYTLSYDLSTDNSLDSASSTNLGDGGVTVAVAAYPLQAQTDKFKIATTGAEYFITLKPGDGTAGGNNANITPTWTAITFGAAAPSQIVTVKNTGNRTLYNVTVALTGTNNGKFIITGENIGTMNVDEVKTFTVTAGANLAAGTYNDVTFTVTANKLEGSTPALNTGVTYAPSLTVNKATLTGATITALDQPVITSTPTPLDTAVTVGAPTNVTAAVTWTDSDTNPLPGKSYTATITLTPDADHKFDNASTVSNVTVNGVAPVSVKAETDGKLTVTYTFAPTAPTMTSATLTATAFDKATVAEVHASAVAPTVYYKIQTSGAAPTAAAIITENLTTASFTNLTPDTAYTVYAAATVTVGGKTSVPSNVVNSADSTWYKLVINHAGHNDGGSDTSVPTLVTAPAVGIKQSAALALSAVPNADHSYWKFGSWAAAPVGGGTFGDANVHDTTYTAPATGNGTNGTITLTATFVGADLSVTSHYPAAGTYGSAYVGTAPTVTAGSGSYTFTSTTLPAGLTLNARTGAISGTPETVGVQKFTVTVKDTKTNAEKAMPETTITVAVATPVFASASYAAGSYFVGDALETGKVTYAYTAPVLTGTTWKTQTLTGADGSIAFAGDSSTFRDGADNDYLFTFTAADKYKDSAGNLVYATASGKITMESAVKSYGLTANPTTAKLKDGVFGSYTVAGTEVTFDLSNTGNQPAVISAVAFTTNTNFETTLLPETIQPNNKETVTVRVKADKLGLAAGTYSDTLKITYKNNGVDTEVPVAVSFTVKKATIAAAQVSKIVAPATGDTVTASGTLVNSAAATSDITSITWVPADATFTAGTQYKVTVLLTAKKDYQFIAANAASYTLADAAGTPNAYASTATVADDGTTVTLSYTFPSTAATLTAVTAVAVTDATATITKMEATSNLPLTYYYVVSAGAAPSAAAIVAGQDSTGATVAAGQKGNTGLVSVSGGKVTATNKQITGLIGGTTYHVYAVGKAEDGTLTNVLSATVIAPYKVTVVSNNPGAGTAAPSDVQYVVPAAKLAISATITAASGYVFTGWTASDASAFDDAAQASTNVTPGSNNITVTAHFLAIPVLKVSGTPNGEEVPNDFDPTLVNVYKDGKVSNTGATMTAGSTLTFVVTAAGSSFTTTDMTTSTFVVSNLSKGNLAQGEVATFVVHPTDNAKNPGTTYQARIWVYEKLSDGSQGKTAPVYFDVSLAVVSAMQPAVQPVQKLWNLSPGFDNGNWVMDVTEKGYDTVTSITLTHVNGTSVSNVLLTPNTDYTYTKATSPSTVGTLTIKKDSYLTNLAAGKVSGNSATLSLVLDHPTSPDSTKTLTITYINTMPMVTGVSVNPNADIGKDKVLTALVYTDSGTPADGQVTYQWYRTKTTANPASDIMNGATGKTYTVGAGDTGYKFYVKATGDGTNYRGEATSALTEAAKFTVKLEAVGNGTVMPAKDILTDGTAGVDITAIPTTGNTFIGWSIKSGTGDFTTDSSGINTVTTEAAVFWANEDATLTATFATLPTLTIAPAIYDNGPGATTNKVAPLLTYVPNAGTLSKIQFSKDSGAFSDLPAAAYDLVSHVYTLKTADGSWLANLTAGDYTIRFVDTKNNATYNREVTLKVNHTTKSLPDYSIEGTLIVGSVLTAKPAVALTGAGVTYQWYRVSGNGTESIIDAQTNQTYTIANADLGCSLRVKVTGTVGYLGSAKQATSGVVSNATHQVIVKVDDALRGGVTVRNTGAPADTITVDNVSGALPITATAKPGFLFVKWTVTLGTATLADQNAANTAVTPTGDCTITATFASSLITQAGISVPAPSYNTALSTSPATIMKPASDANFTVDAPVWTKKDGTPASGTAAADTIYVSKVTLTPKPGYTFDLPAILTTVECNTAVPDGTKVIATQVGDTIEITFEFPATGKAIVPPTPGGGGGGGTTTAYTVTYDLRELGSTKDKTTESVSSGSKPKKVPAVDATEGLTFTGWSLENPETAKDEVKLVKPQSVSIKADTTFFAVYSGHIIKEHEHYVVGYQEGTFEPARSISRGEVAAIVARAILPKFVEGNDYGAGGYNDVANNWAKSAIAFCTSQGVFEGYVDGSFRPNMPITRQEFAVVFARLAGIKSAQTMPFTDIDTAGDWAKDGIYTAYLNKWVDGYTDGTFRPLENIHRDEAVKITNRYLNRGVDEVGIQLTLKDLKSWPDVPNTYWAYYEIMEASNDHTFHYKNEKRPPENWTKAFVEKTSWNGK